MKSHRVAYVLAAVAVLGMVAGCANHTADSEAPVFLTADVRQANVDIDISVPFDVGVPEMNIDSHLKSIEGTPTVQQNVELSEWVVTYTRSDGGTVSSPVWHNFESVSVPAGGTASLQNYRIFPSDYYKLAPLNQLFPENGGFDAETGKRNIRQRAHVDLYGQTVAGRKVSVSFDINLNFFYVTP